MPLSSTLHPMFKQSNREGTRFLDSAVRSFRFGTQKGDQDQIKIIIHRSSIISVT